MEKLPLSQLQIGEKGVITGVTDSSTVFLQYLDKVGIAIGLRVEIMDLIEYDGSLEIILGEAKNLNISKKVAENIDIAKL